MAYMNQERKTHIAPKVKEILKRYGIKGSLAVRDHMTLVLNISEGSIDFISNYADTMGASRHLGHKPNGYLNVNCYHYRDHFSDVARKCLDEVYAAMMEGNWDKSQIEYDIHDVGWYVDINIGRWNKPYRLTA